MSSLLRLIKKKFQPIKRHLTCSSQVAAASTSRSASSSFEATPEKAKKHHELSIRSKAIHKRSKSNNKANDKTKKARNAIQRTPNELKRMSNKTMSPTPSTLIFDSPGSRVNATTAPASHNSRILDYFKHLERAAKVKRTTNVPMMATTRTINEKKAAAAAAATANENPPMIVVSTDSDLNEEVITTRVIKESASNAEIEIERIQDELFDDGLTPKPCRSLLHTTSSPLSVISVSSFASSSPTHSTSQLEFKGASDLSENPFVNRPIEKIRRSVSSPKIIVNLNSTAAAAVIPRAKNVSGVSLIREDSMAVTAAKLSSPRMTSIEDENNNSSGNSSTTLAAPNDNFEQSQAAIQPQPVPDHIEDEDGGGENHFVRGGGETSSRISTKLKHKFKDLIEQQTSAIQKVQMFYESEINKIEMERVKLLADIQCGDDEQKKLVNDFYDEQLQKLEERVEAKLKMLREKSNFEAKPPVNQDINRIAQLMILKLQHQQQQQQQQRTHQGRTRTLSGLKASIVAANQNNLLPPKVTRRVDSVTTNDEVSNEEVERETGFKRNPSLRQKMSDDHQTKPKSPRASKLTYSSSRASRHTNESPSFNNRLHMRPPKASHAFVKNSAQKKQQMMESLRRAAPQLQNEADDEDSREAAGFKPFVATAEAFLSVPNYAQIKRDRTASAMRPHPMFYGSSNFDSMSLYSLNSLCYEINPAQQQQQQQPSLYKYLSPRLSDGHLQYKMKLANFSRAGAFEQQEQPSTRLFHSHSHRSEYRFYA